MIFSSNLNSTFVAFHESKTSSLAEDDDVLPEVQPHVVPAEVRDWLSSTFTRKLVSTQKANEEKPKFRTVAHAIRAGIFVDRIYRQILNSSFSQFPPEVLKILKVSNFILLGP